MGYTFAKIEREDFVTTVIVHNPPANTLSSACIEELRQIFKSLADDKETRAIILTGSGRFFIAGANIKEFVSAFDDKEKALKMGEAGQSLCNEIEAMKKPVIAAINGPALGGGLEAALSCHYRIASERAVVGLPELKLGLLPTFGGTQRLNRLTNTAEAMKLILTSRQLTAEEAKALNIIQMVTIHEELLDIAVTTAKTFIEGKSMTSIMRTVECIIQGQKGVDEGMELERQRFAELFLTNDAKEGVEEFIEKREPRFTHS